MQAKSPGLVGAAEVEALLDYPSLIEALRAAFLDPPDAPERLSLPLDDAGARMLVMPAVRRGALAIVKVVAVHPRRRVQGGAVHATLLALDARTGEFLRLVDGHSLTVRRTAAASALAASVLARPGASRLAVLGAGAVAEALAQAHASRRTLDDIVVWARRPEAADALAFRLRAEGLPARASPDIAAAVQAADIVSAATLSAEPLVLARHVAEGAHVDLVGGFTPAMREADDALMARARVVADGPIALREAGDLAGPIAAGVLRASAVALFADVLRDPPARAAGEITVFKSVGLALEDLAAAELLLSRLGGAHGG